MTAEIPETAAQPEVRAIERDDPLENAPFNPLMIRHAREASADVYGTEQTVAMAGSADEVTVRLPDPAAPGTRYHSRRGGRAFPEKSGRDIAREIAEQHRASEAGRVVAAPDSFYKLAAFAMAGAKDATERAKIKSKIDAYDRGEKVDLYADDDEVA